MENRISYFEGKYPSLCKGGAIGYWPSPSQDLPLFLEKKSQIKPILIENAKTYMAELGLESLINCFRVSEGDKHLFFSIDDERGWRWFYIEDGPGHRMIRCRDLSAAEGVIAFNIASDVLEHINDGKKAPRIFYDGKNKEFRFTYPFCDYLMHMKMLHYIETMYKGDWVRENFGKIEFADTEKVQEMITEKGKICLENEVCEGTGFKLDDLANATAVMADMLYRASGD